MVTGRKSSQLMGIVYRDSWIASFGWHVIREGRLAIAQLIKALKAKIFFFFFTSKLMRNINDLTDLITPQ
jgi:hypothetical protein